MRARPRARRKPYPSTVTDEEWAFVAPYLTLCREDASQRQHALRHVYNALRWVVRAGVLWRYLPTGCPPWELVYQQTQRWIAAGCFEAIVHDLRALLRVTEDRESAPSDLADVVCSSGSACQSGAILPSHVLSAMGVRTDLANAAIRMSLGALTTNDCIDRVSDLFPALISKARGLVGVA